MSSRLQPFACPVCGRIRQLSPAAANAIGRGAQSGECAPGVGCRTAIDQPERYRRFWLIWAGVTELELRTAGGSIAYVLEFGLPAQLWALAGILPPEAIDADQPLSGEPTGSRGRADLLHAPRAGRGAPPVRSEPVYRLARAGLPEWLLEPTEAELGLDAA
jgi:hypothetical protein